MQDIRYAYRTLRRSPGFAALVIAILALGIGANTAVFSVVNSVLLRPLPYPHSERLVLIWETNPRLHIEREGPSGPNFLDWRDQNRSFEDMGLLENGTGTLTGSGEPIQFPGARVTTNFLSLLGAKAKMGRLFRPEDGEGAARHNVAVITYGFWQRQFGGDPDIIGRRLTVNHQIYECVGVLTPDMWSPVAADAFVPWPAEELRRRSRFNRDFGVVARLKPGVTFAAAQQDMDSISARLAKEYPRLEDWKTVVVPFQNALVEYIRPALWMLQASVLFVLLLACANVANLLLARMTGRRLEVSIRAALGADRRRLLRQFLAENLVVSLLGGAGGMLAAIWGVDLLRRLLPPSIPLPNGSTEIILPPISVDPAVLVFAMIVSLVCSVLFGLAPALQASRTDLNGVLKEGGRGSTGSTGAQRVRRLLVISETALAFLLLMGAALTMRSFFELSRVNPGIRPDRVLSFRLRLPTDALYQRPEQQVEFFRRALDEVRTVPGVESAGFTEVIPLGQENSRTAFRIENAATPAELSTDSRRVTPGFFETVGIPLVNGRLLDQRDTAGRPLVVLVDEVFARQYFPNENPIGRRIVMGAPREIVGVVAPVRHRGLDQPPRATVYIPQAQAPVDRMALLVKTTVGREQIVPSIKQAIWRVDPDQPVFMIRSMDEYIALANSAPRIALLLLGVFAGVALTLAAFGIYGVVSYTVAQRTHEFGLRMALGAEPSEIRSLVMRSGLKWALAGLLAGFGGLLLLAPALGSVLYGIRPFDPPVAAGASLLLLGVAALANYVPARRATRVDPISALRYE